MTIARNLLFLLIIGMIAPANGAASENCSFCDPVCNQSYECTQCYGDCNTSACDAYCGAMSAGVINVDCVPDHFVCSHIESGGTIVTCYCG
jgi:hypothetical protein